MMNRIKQMILKEKTLSINVLGAFLVKGASMLLQLFTIPAYMKYFHDDAVLGIWYTMLSVLTWITMFDLGIGNGLRNKLAESLAKNERIEAKEYISSAYLIITCVSLGLAILFTLINPYINWNKFLNVSENNISRIILSKGMSIIIYGILIRLVLALANSMLYAVQKSAINNFLLLITNFLIFIYVLIAPNGNVETNLINLSYCQLFFSNIPLLLTTIVLFFRSLKGLAPNIHYFNRDKAKSVFSIGLVLLWLQIVAMVILSTHAFLISTFVGPKQVVEYNIYYKVINTIASIVVLALTPIWSAVTKAQAEKKYKWIKKIYLVSLLLPVITFVIGILIIPILQTFFNMWLKDNTIQVDYLKVIIMIIFNFLFVLHHVNTSINNGMSQFKTQLVWMTVGAILMIPLSNLFCGFIGDWTGVIIACSISILPYEIIQPIISMKKLGGMNQNGENNE